MSSGLKNTRAKLAASFRESPECHVYGRRRRGRGGRLGRGVPRHYQRRARDRGPPVWEIYRRPRAGTDASAGASARGGPSAAASTESLSGGGLKKERVAPPGGAEEGARPAQAEAEQQEPAVEPEHAELAAQPEGEPEREQPALGREGAATTSRGSMTSLESIPEGVAAADAVWRRGEGERGECARDESCGEEDRPALPPAAPVAPPVRGQLGPRVVVGGAALGYLALSGGEGWRVRA